MKTVLDKKYCNRILPYAEKGQKFSFKWITYILVKIVIMLTCLTATLAYSASFDCAKASTKMEKTICGDSKLSVLDEQLAKIYAETKKQIKDDVPSSNKLTKSQREWLAGLRKKTNGADPCVVNKRCLINGYQKRIKELQNWMPATNSNDHSEKLVMQRLSGQLEKLKIIARKSKAPQISETLSANKPLVCRQIFTKLPEASVPKPTIFANTPQQQQELYAMLREMAYHNQQLFLSSQSGHMKDMKRYKRNFDYAWKEFRGFGEFANKHKKNLSYMFFARSDTNTGAKQPVIVTVLLDSKGEDLSLSREAIGLDGLWNQRKLAESAYSFEYWKENLLDEPQNYIETPPESIGILTLNDEIMFWQLRKEQSFGKNNWMLEVRPVKNPQDGQEISCSFEF